MLKNLLLFNFNLLKETVLVVDFDDYYLTCTLLEKNKLYNLWQALIKERCPSAGVKDCKIVDMLKFYESLALIIRHIEQQYGKSVKNVIWLPNLALCKLSNMVIKDTPHHKIDQNYINHNIYNYQNYENYIDKHDFLLNIIPEYLLADNNYYSVNELIQSNQVVNNLKVAVNLLTISYEYIVTFDQVLQLIGSKLIDVNSILHHLLPMNTSTKFKTRLIIVLQSYSSLGLLFYDSNLLQRVDADISINNIFQTVAKSLNLSLEKVANYYQVLLQKGKKFSFVLHGRQFSYDEMLDCLLNTISAQIVDLLNRSFKDCYIYINDIILVTQNNILNLLNESTISRINSYITRSVIQYKGLLTIKDYNDLDYNELIIEHGLYNSDKQLKFMQHLENILISWRRSNDW